MKLEVLVSTMYQNDHSLVKAMNIQTDAIIINQCNQNNFEEFEMDGKKIRFLSFNERGIGLSRNNALMRATADICIFADDDVEYVDNYENLILQAFKENPKADIILFNVPSTNSERPTYTIPKKSRVRRYNCLRYGAVKIAIKTDKIKQANIYYSLLFGGGAKYSSGEDSLFIADCVRKGLKVYTNPTIIGYVKQDKSTWFCGYNEKFFKDKGALFAHLSHKWRRILCLQFVVRHYKMFDNGMTIREMYNLMIKGVKEIC